MKLNKILFQTIFCILMLTIAEMANIAEKRRVSRPIRLTRNARSNAKAKEIATIISVGLKVISFFVQGFIDSKIIDKYKSLKHHQEVTEKLAAETENFLNKFNGKKCLFYHRFDMINKSTLFMLQKFKNAVRNFSPFFEKENNSVITDAADDIVEDDSYHINVNSAHKEKEMKKLKTFTSLDNQTNAKYPKTNGNSINISTNPSKDQNKPKIFIN